MNLAPVVLVVEDSDEDFATAGEALARARVASKLERVASGDDCLEWLRAPERASAPLALVLLDLNTPGLDGRATLCAIRRDTELAWVPVVVLSTSANPRDVAFCYERGANAYHVKPVRYPDHIEVLVDIFRYWLSRVVLPTQGSA